MEIEEEKIIKWFLENRNYPTSPFEAEKKARTFIEDMQKAE